MCFCLLAFFGFIAIAQERGFQLWNQNNLEININEKYLIGAGEKVQYRTESGMISMKSGDLYLRRKVLPWFDIGLAGRIILLNNQAEWVQENRTMIYGNLKKNMGQLSFDLSNRVEYRMYKVLNDHFRHRHMFSAETCPFSKASWFSLYLSEEAFYLLEENKFHLVRLYTGTRIKYSKSVEMKLYYVFEKLRKPDHWNTSDVIGLNMKIGL